MLIAFRADLWAISDRARLVCYGAKAASFALEFLWILNSQVTTKLTLFELIKLNACRADFWEISNRVRLIGNGAKAASFAQEAAAGQMHMKPSLPKASSVGANGRARRKSITLSIGVTDSEMRAASANCSNLSSASPMSTPATTSKVSGSKGPVPGKSGGFAARIKSLAGGIRESVTGTKKPSQVLIRDTLQHTTTHCNTLCGAHQESCGRNLWVCNWYKKPSQVFLRNTLQHTTIHCSTLQHTTTHFAARIKSLVAGICESVIGTKKPSQVFYRHTLRHTVKHCNTLRYTAMDCYTPLHTATHCYTLQHSRRTLEADPGTKKRWHLSTRASASAPALQHTAIESHCNTNTLQHIGAQVSVCVHAPACARIGVWVEDSAFSRVQCQSQDSDGCWGVWWVSSKRARAAGYPISSALAPTSSTPCSVLQCVAVCQHIGLSNLKRTGTH